VQKLFNNQSLAQRIFIKHLPVLQSFCIFVGFLEEVQKQTFKKTDECKFVQFCVFSRFSKSNFRMKQACFANSATLWIANRPWSNFDMQRSIRPIFKNYHG